MYCFNTYPYLPAAVFVTVNIFDFCAEYRHIALLFGTFYLSRILKTAPDQKNPLVAKKSNRIRFSILVSCHTVIPSWMYRVSSEPRSQATVGESSTLVGDNKGIIRAVWLFNKFFFDFDQDTIFYFILLSYGHTQLNVPRLIRTAKSSNCGRI